MFMNDRMNVRSFFRCDYSELTVVNRQIYGEKETCDIKRGYVSKLKQSMRLVVKTNAKKSMAIGLIFSIVSSSLGSIMVSNAQRRGDSSSSTVNESSYDSVDASEFEELAPTPIITELEPELCDSSNQVKAQSGKKY